MTKPLLPTATDALLGIYRAALADVPEGATQRPAPRLRAPSWPALPRSRSKSSGGLRSGWRGKFTG